MLPKMPRRGEQPGFIYVPPYRIQGVSIAGEQTTVGVPELDLAFDIGLCPRVVLPMPYVAISHGHMDHVAGLPYYFSQRMFQKMSTGTAICHHRLAAPLLHMMKGWIDVEQQQTPHKIIGIEDGQSIQIKPNVFLRGVEMIHTVPAMGYAVVEKRSKLKEEFFGLPQDRLRELKASGTEITRILEIPLIAYTGDTEMGPNLYRDEFAEARVVISECTFFEPEQRDRSSVGKHLHADDIRTLLDVWKAEAVILIHLSRRTNLAVSREHLMNTLGEEKASRVHFLMDHRSNRARYERQLAEAEAAAGAGA